MIVGEVAAAELLRDQYLGVEERVDCCFVQVVEADSMEGASLQRVVGHHISKAAGEVHRRVGSLPVEVEAEVRALYC